MFIAIHDPFNMLPKIDLIVKLSNKLLIYIYTVTTFKSIDLVALIVGLNQVCPGPVPMLL